MPAAGPFAAGRTPPAYCPVPVTATDVGLLVALLVTTNEALRAPVPDGLNVNET